MSDALTKLKDLGAQKIYEDTHIPIGHVQAVLDEDYEALTRIQFLGFLSILERDYNIDLEDVRSRAIAYYEEQTSSQPLADDGIFVVPSRPKNFTLFYIILVIFIFLVALYYTVDVANQKNNENLAKVQHKTLPVKENNLTNENEELISTSDDNSTQLMQEQTDVNDSNVSNVAAKLEPLEILPRSRVWLGYIDVATDKKYQKTFSDELDLDPTKEWIFIFGHGYVDVIANDKKIHFSDKKTLRLHYQNGQVDKITVDEFKQLNRGHKW
jgi:hypothetical protein